MLWGSAPESWGLLPGAMAQLRSVMLDNAHNWLDGLPAGTLCLLVGICTELFARRGPLTLPVQCMHRAGG